MLFLEVDSKRVELQSDFEEFGQLTFETAVVSAKGFFTSVLPTP